MDLTKIYAAHIVLGIEFMHSKNVVHRDLKPGNLLIDKSKRLKLIDFGEARQLDPNLDPYEPLDTPDIESNEMNAELEEEERKTNMFVGTPLYQCPEMLMHSISSPAMDLWALGVIIYEMLIGKTPFHSNSEIEVYRKIEIREMNIPPNIKE